MNKGILIMSIAVTIFVINGCIYPGTIHADGWLPRTVRVSVWDNTTGQKIVGAKVRLIPAEGMERFLDRHRYERLYEGMTDASGVAKLAAWFGFWSKQTF